MLLNNFPFKKLFFLSDVALDPARQPSVIGSTGIFISFLAFNK